MDPAAAPSLPAVAAEVAAAARATEDDPAFPREAVERIRAATGWLGAAEPAADDVRRAALVLSRQAEIGLSAPTTARSTPRRLVKHLVNRAVGWYFRFLAEQLAAVGRASASLGLAAARRFEGAEAEQAAIRGELDGLRARVARLEEALGPAAPAPEAGGAGKAVAEPATR